MNCLWQDYTPWANHELSKGLISVVHPFWDGSMRFWMAFSRNYDDKLMKLQKYAVDIPFAVHTLTITCRFHITNYLIWISNQKFSLSGPMVKRRLMSVLHQTTTHWMLPVKSESSKHLRFCDYRVASFEIQLHKSQFEQLCPFWS